MNVLFIVPYPLGQAASQRYRVEQWLPLLERHGVQNKIASFWKQGTWDILYKPGYILQKAAGLLAGVAGRLLLLPKLPRYDYVFIHREATPLGPPWFEWVAAKVFRKKLIFDFDDAIWLPNTSEANSLTAKLKWHPKVAQICRWSHKVSCGNGYLKDYALQYNSEAVLLPSVLDTEEVYTEYKNQLTDGVTIGWIGSHSTLPYLQLLAGVLQRLEQQYSFRVLVIADKPPQLTLRSLVFKRWQQETEIQDLLQLNIGVMPLPDTEWCKGKCAFKALQYMALGIPAVVSGVGANADAVANGATGYVCNTAQEWYERLEQMLLDADLRTTLGSAGQELVRARYSLQAQEKTFLSLFS